VVLNKIRFTEIETIKPTYLTKVFELHPNGSVTKETNGHLSHGIATALGLSVPEMVEYLRELPTNRSLVYGTPEHEESIVLSAKERKSWVSQPGDIIICRDNKDIRWNLGPGWLMLDHDFEEGREPLTREEFLQALYSIWPALQSKPHIWLPSASSCIYYPNGKEYRGVASQRLLVPLEKGGDVPRLLRILNMRLWLNGHGFIRVSNSGAQLVRSIIDVCTGQPSRLDFIGGALCLGGLYQTRKELITAYNVEAPFVTRNEYPTITREERREYENRLQREIRKTARKARRQRAIWVQERIATLLKDIPVADRERKRAELQRIYGHAAEHGELLGDFKLWCHTYQCHVTVGEILNDIEKFDSVEFADPLEPDNEDKRVAIARLKHNPPILYSHLHGGVTFVLKKEITKHSQLPEAENKLEEFLSKYLPAKLAFVTPSVGKTRLAIKEAIRRTEAGVVIYTMANHQLINSTLKRLDIQPEVKVIHYYGRWWEHKMGNTFKEGKAKNCSPEKMNEVTKAASMGYAPASVVCRHCRHAPWIAKDGSGKPCRYWRQLQGLKNSDQAIIFCTTLGLGSLLDQLSQTDKNLDRESITVKEIYIDEQAADAMISQFEPPLTSDAIKTVQGFISPEAFEVVQKLVEGVDETVTLVQAEGLTDEKFYVHPDESELGLIEFTDLSLSDLDVLRNELKELTKADRFEKEEFYQAGLNYNAVRWLSVLVKEKSGGKNVWVTINTADASGHAKFYFSEIRQLPKNARLTILDATGDISENERIFGRTFETLDLKVGWEGTGIWLQNRRSKTVLLQMSDAEIEREIEEEILPFVPVNKQKGFLITAKDVEKQVLKILRKLVPEIEWKTTHYWGSRGLNDFEDCDFGLAYGFAFKNVCQLEDDARTIFGSDEIARKRWCSQQNHNELYQGVERLRLCRNPGRTLIVFGPVYPVELLGQPFRHEDLRQETRLTASELAAERICEFMTVTGILACCKRLGWLLNICRKVETEKMVQLRKSCFPQLEDGVINSDVQPISTHESAIIYSSSFMGSETATHLCLSNLATKTVFRFLKTAGSFEWIVSTDSMFWENVWTEILSRKPDLEKLYVKHGEIHKQKPSLGVGHVKDGEYLDLLLQGIGLKPGTWLEGGGIGKQEKGFILL
jgi:hypothetical protein